MKIFVTVELISSRPAHPRGVGTLEIVPLDEAADVLPPDDETRHP